MTPPFSFTREQIIEMLEDFQEWYEGDWLSDKVIRDDYLSAAEWFLSHKLLDPCWSDRPISSN